MEALGKKPGKSSILEDSRVVLVCDKMWRRIGYPLIMIFLGGTPLLLGAELLEEPIWIVYEIVMVMIGILFYLEVYKTIILSEKGVTIKIARYERFFKWNELREKKVEIVKDHENITLAFFSLKSASNRPKWITAIDFCYWRPFTSFYVILDYDWEFLQSNEWEGKMFNFSEPVFLRKMQEWNIELVKDKVVYSEWQLLEFRNR